MDCLCHGVPAYWQKDKRRKRGGTWRCAVKKRAANRRNHASHADERCAREMERYYAVGWAKKRRRALAAQRADVLDRLGQLAQEANGAQS